MKSRKTVIYVVMSVIVILFIVISFSYAFLAADKTIMNNLAVNTTIANGTAVNFVVNGNQNMSISISGANMLGDSVNNVAGTNSTSLSISLTSAYNVTCTYAISWKWLANSDTYEKSITTEKEFVVSGTDGTQQLNEANIPYSIEKAKVLGRYSISTNNSTTTQNWTFTTKFYNVNANQDHHENKNYMGQIVIENAHCYESTRQTLANYIISQAGNSATNNGVDAQSHNWFLFSTTHTSDSKTDYRYAGSNPNNFIMFNGEYWRIIGVMPVDYDTDGDGVPDTTSNLVKIVRNTTLNTTNSYDYKQTGVGSSVGNNGSNNWGDSQTMVMTNPLEFLTTSYAYDGSVPTYSYVRGEYAVSVINNVNYLRTPGSFWNSYTSIYQIKSVTTSGYTGTSTYTQCGTSATATGCLRPFSADAQGVVATVKWNLGGGGAADYTAEQFYQYERGTSVCASTSGSSCSAGNESTIRPTYWYGKVGLPYVSDFGYASGGSDNGTTFSRATCLSTALNASGNFRTYCGTLNYLVYRNATATSRGTAGSTFTITPKKTANNSEGGISSSGYFNFFSTWSTNNMYNRAVLYLDPRVVYLGGDGSYNNPYQFL